MRLLLLSAHGVCERKGAQSKHLEDKSTEQLPTEESGCCCYLFSVAQGV